MKNRSIGHVMTINGHVRIVKVAEILKVDIDGTRVARIFIDIMTQIEIVVRILEKRRVDICAFDFDPSDEIVAA